MARQCCSTNSSVTPCRCSSCDLAPAATQLHVMDRDKQQCMAAYIHDVLVGHTTWKPKMPHETKLPQTAENPHL